MIRTMRLAIAGFMLIFVCACIDEVNFDVPREYQNSTVIIGKLVAGNPAVVEVYIQKIFDFSFEDEVFVRPRSIRIVNEDGNKLEIPIENFNTNSLIIDESMNFDVSVGKTYSLEVDLFDGQQFKSKMEAVLPVPKMQSLKKALVQKEIINYLGETVIRNKLKTFVNTPLKVAGSADNTNVKWDFEFVYKQTDDTGKACYINGFPDFDLIQLVDGNTIDIDFVEEFELIEQNITTLMVEGYSLAVIQEALSDEALIFWQQVLELSENSGTFYEPPPGQLVSNFEVVSPTEGDVFGYFYATEQDTLRTFVNGDFVEFSTKICPSPPTGGPDPPCDHCCDCELAANSTTRKPDFWIN